MIEFHSTSCQRFQSNLTAVNSSKDSKNQWTWVFWQSDCHYTSESDNILFNELSTISIQFDSCQQFQLSFKLKKNVHRPSSFVDACLPGNPALFLHRGHRSACPRMAGRILYPGKRVGVAVVASVAGPAAAKRSRWSVRLPRSATDSVCPYARKRRYYCCWMLQHLANRPSGQSCFVLPTNLYKKK